MRLSIYSVGDGEALNSRSVSCVMYCLMDYPKWFVTRTVSWRLLSLVNDGVRDISV